MGGSRFFVGVLAACLSLAGYHARAADASLPRAFHVPPGDLATGLEVFLRESGVQLIYRLSDVRGLHTPGVDGAHTPEQALAILLHDTGLQIQRDRSGAVALVPALPPVAAHSKANPVAREQRAQPPLLLEGILVTAQKHVERVQDVPMAISVLGGGDLDALKIESGGELLRGTPNATFSKTNFSTHNFQIRGVGTQALSVTADSGVAINFNGMPLVRNRFYEQEYFDVNRIEVLRGPQGTLHSRNATAGVIDMIPNLPGADFDANLKVETGSFGLQRLSGMINQPITDRLWLRVAGIQTQRDGIDYNTVTGRHVNDRDLKEARLSVAWEPNDQLQSNFVWEHFKEHDRRARTGKQLCHPDPAPSRIGTWVVPTGSSFVALFNQSCLPGSLYTKDAFGVPNGASLPQLNAYKYSSGKDLGVRLLDDDDYEVITAIKTEDNPYAGVEQSRDLRKISTQYDPRFDAASDTIQFNAKYIIDDQHVINSQTGWSFDRYWSTQDYNRFPSNPIFESSDGLFRYTDLIINDKLVPAYPLIPGGDI